jgi:hypothetical protein
LWAGIGPPAQSSRRSRPQLWSRQFARPCCARSAPSDRQSFLAPAALPEGEMLLVYESVIGRRRTGERRLDGPKARFYFCRGLSRVAAAVGRPSFECICETPAALWLADSMFAIQTGLDKQEIAMPDPRKSAGCSPPAGAPSTRDGMKASAAEVEFQRVIGIARTRLDRGELSAGAFAAILKRARMSRDAAADEPATQGHA